MYQLFKIDFDEPISPYKYIKTYLPDHEPSVSYDLEHFWEYLNDEKRYENDPDYNVPTIYDINELDKIINDHCYIDDLDDSEFPEMTVTRHTLIHIVFVNFGNNIIKIVTLPHP